MNIEKTKLIELKEKFDSIINKEEKENIEFWYARDLQIQLGYKRWENFIETIKKAMKSCANTGITVEDHFREVTKMIKLAKGAKRTIQDYMLTRYACYLIAQNGDPKKEEIAFAQTYFALQTRKQEIIEDRIKLINRLEVREKLRESEKQLSKNIYERGVDDLGFARIPNFPNLYVRKKQSPERRTPRIYSNENSNPGKMTKIDPNTNPKIKK